MNPEESIPYQLGRMFGMALIGLLSVGGIIFFIVAVVKACTKKTTGWIVASVIVGVLGLLIVASTGAAFVAGITRALVERGKSKELTTPDGMHRIVVPGPWKAMPELNREAQIAAAYPRREEYVVVFVERKLNSTMILADYANATADAMVAKLKNGALGKLTELTVGKFPAMRRRLTGRLERHDVAFHHTCVDMPDHLVQVLCWTLANRETTAFPVFEKIAASFAATGKVLSPAEQVHQLIIELLGTDKTALKDASRLKEDLGADELDHVELVMAVEEEFGVSVPDEMAEKWKTVGDITRWVEAAKIKTPPSSAAPKAD
jgi:acyl carrier protein